MTLATLYNDNLIKNSVNLIAHFLLAILNRHNTERLSIVILISDKSFFDLHLSFCVHHTASLYLVIKCNIGGNVKTDIHLLKIHDFDIWFIY